MSAYDPKRTWPFQYGSLSQYDGLSCLGITIHECDPKD